jgi:AAA15 family ATPase/GTPase
VNNRPNELFFLDNYQSIAVLGATVAYDGNNTGKSNLLKAIKARE